MDKKVIEQPVVHKVDSAPPEREEEWDVWFWVRDNWEFLDSYSSLALAKQAAEKAGRDGAHVRVLHRVLE
jgi:hypothetical protein